ncbi:MAG: exo-alpha-sialidase, partial [Polaromonas sp.]
MKRFLSVMGSLVALGLMGGCAAIGSGSTAAVLAQVDDITTGSLQTRPAIVEVNGKPALLYSTKDDRVIFRQGERLQRLDETARVRGGNHFQLHLQDQNLQALWWSHQDGKNVYSAASADAGQHFDPASMVNDDHGILPPFTVTRGPKGILGLTYQDERLPGYEAFFNRSTDYGRTWARPDQRLDTPPAKGRSSDVHESQSVAAGTAWVSTWTDVDYSTGSARYRIVSRRSEDTGQSWAPQEVLYSSDRQISSLVVRAQGDSVVVAADELSRGILAFVSQDQGRTWRATGILAGTDDVSNSGIEMAVAGGRAHLVWMQDRKDEKTRIMRGSLGTAQGKWLSSVQRLDLKAHDNTRSVSPTILATSQGALLATWVDYRDIRTNIYVAASYDQGQVWSAPQALLKPGEVAAGWPQLVPWGGHAAIAYEIYPTDRVMEGKLVLRLLAGQDGAGGLAGMASPSPMSEADRKAKLEQRVKLLWDSRV